MAKDRKQKQQLNDTVRVAQVGIPIYKNGRQIADVKVRAGVIDTQVTRLQNAGFTSMPAGEVIGVEVTANGNRYLIALDGLDHPEVAAGESMVWSACGDFIHLKDTNEIEFKTKTLRGNCEEIIFTGDMSVDGTLDVTGIITSDIDVIAGEEKVSVVQHDHDYTPGTGTQTQTSSANGGAA